MLEIGKEVKVARELRRCKINVMALQKIMWSNQGQINKDEVMILYSGNGKQGQSGVALLTNGKSPGNDEIGIEMIKYN